MYIPWKASVVVAAFPLTMHLLLMMDMYSLSHRSTLPIMSNSCRIVVCTCPFLQARMLFNKHDVRYVYGLYSVHVPSVDADGALPLSLVVAMCVSVPVAASIASIGVSCASTALA